MCWMWILLSCIIITILQMRKQSLREVQLLVRGHRTGVLELPVWKEAFLIYADLIPQPTPRLNVYFLVQLTEFIIPSAYSSLFSHHTYHITLPSSPPSEINLVYLNKN